MDTPFANDLTGFQQFVNDKVARGATSLSPEEVIDEWRTLHRDPDELAEDMAAIQEAIDDMEAGDEGVPLEEFIAEIRKERGWPVKP